MIILAFDSSALTASVALCDGERLLGEITLNNGNTHSETLLPMAEFLLSQSNRTVKDVDLFAVSAGPGSFTGVRIGVATVKGLAFSTGKPCFGVSTLEALAYNLNVLDGIVVPVMNARRGQVYTAIFRFRNGIAERLMEDSAIAISELDERLSIYETPICPVGDGYEIIKNGLTHPIREIPERLRHQSAYSVASIARKAYEAGERPSDRELAPTYLRLSQAERERTEREKRERGEVSEYTV